MPVVTDVAADVVSDLTANLDALCQAGSALADGEVIVALHRQLARLEAVATRAVAAFDASKAWEDDGARSAAAWVTTRCRVPGATARRRVRTGRALRHMALVEESWLGGDIGEAQVGLLLDGRWFLDGLLDPISGAVVSNALRGIEDELFAADWAEARPRVGDDVSVSDLARTPAQRRADALVEMARRAGAVAPGARMPDPLFSVFVGYETFSGRICQLADGTVVAPGALIRWLDEAWVERIVFDGPDRVRNVGERRRLFTGATRRGVEVRDRECFHEFCDVPAEDCEIDHIQPYSEGGLTVDSNARPACGHHNRERHRRPQPP